LLNKPVVEIQGDEDAKRPGSGDDSGDQKRKLSDEEKSAQEAKLLKQLLSEGKYHVLPSFFRTLIFLKKMKKEFSIIFRNYN